MKSPLECTYAILASLAETRDPITGKPGGSPKSYLYLGLQHADPSVNLDDFTRLLANLRDAKMLSYTAEIVRLTPHGMKLGTGINKALARTD